MFDRKFTTEDYKELLEAAHAFSKVFSGCRKVCVGSVIVEPDFYSERGYNIISSGANRAIPNLCRSTECRRVQLYGEDSKSHRLPSDCRAIHSELDAIITAKTNLHDDMIVVTRYPCEACARAIVAAGIKTVVYGRKQKITEETQNIFDSAKVTVIHIEDWDAEDTER